MTLTIDTIKTKIEKLTCEWGGQGNVALTGQAHHECNPNHPHRWMCQAIQIDGDILHTGRALWDFTEFEEQCEEDGVIIDDDGMYPWNEFDFEACETYNLNDEDDLETIEELGIFDIK